MLATCHTWSTTEERFSSGKDLPGPGETAHWVKGLLRMNVDQSSIPTIYVKKKNKKKPSV